VAQRNISDAVSATSIIDGALEQQGSVLTRLAELAEQSSTGTMSSGQRSTMQQEFQELLEEYDRIANSTSFNGLELLNGRTNLSFQAGITGSSRSQISMSTVDSRLLSGNINPDTINDYNRNGAIDPSDVQYFYGDGLQVNRTEAELSAIFGSSILFVDTVDMNSGATIRAAVLMIKVESSNELGFVAFAGNADGTYFGSLDAQNEAFQIIGGSSTYDAIFAIDSATGLINGNNKVTLTTLSSGTGSLGGDFVLDLSGLTFKSSQPTDVLYGARIDTESRGRATLDVIQNRIAKLAETRGVVGASTSRLLSAQSLARGAALEMLAARGRVMDADIAAESARLSTITILQQAAVAVLAQANIQPRLALELLRG
jgi:flagellin